MLTVLERQLTLIDLSPHLQGDFYLFIVNDIWFYVSHFNNFN